MTPQTQAQKDKEAEARKRSEAAKKAAATRKKNEEEEAKKANGGNGNDSSEPKKGDAGPIPARFSGVSAPEPPAVVLSEKERRAAEHELREEHNARTGGGTVRSGEVEKAHDEHNRRTAGINV